MLETADLACIQTLSLAGEYPYLVASLRAISVPGVIMVHYLEHTPGAFTFLLGAQRGFAFVSHPEVLGGRCSEIAKRLFCVVPESIN